LAITGMIAAGSRLDSPSALLQSGVACYVLVLGFRVWDDLEDRARDRREHPERVLVQATSVAPFVALATVAFALATAIVAAQPNGIQRLAILGAGVAVLFAWYHARRAINASPVAGMAVIFAKYPLIAFVAAPPARSTPIALSAAVLFSLYAALCMYELHDDATIRAPIP
jgi:4-hydroxybenzoate polyprenyltransferase